MRKGLLILSCMSVFLLFSLSRLTIAADSVCGEFIEIKSVKQLAKELGKPPKWVTENYRIKLFDKEPSKSKKGKVVGKLLPGSRAEIIKVGDNDYQVKSPLDGSLGWVSKAHVRHTLLLDRKTLGLCR